MTQTFGALAPHLHRAVASMGFTQPTPIQVQAIPVVLAGRDVAAEAQTGSGKTLAFALPILHGIPDGSGLSALVVVPTRELAHQVARTFVDLSQYAPVATAVVIGGTDLDAQITRVAAARVVVATPGRLLDLVERAAIDLSQVRTLVFDEADKLLDAGFQDQVQPLLAGLPTERQTLLFSATLSQRVLSLSQGLLRDPVTVRIDRTPTPVQGIEQRVFQVDRRRRRALFQQLVTEHRWGQTLVFVGTRRAAVNLAAKLRIAGFRASALHGDLEQRERERELRRFRLEGIQILVATDLAARGLDIPQLGAVVNWDLPRSPADYVHRIGRTGRAGKTGVAVSFIDHDSAAHFALIEKRAGIRLAREQVPGFELTGEPPPKTKGAGGVKGRRKSKKDRLREAKARQERDG